MVDLKPNLFFKSKFTIETGNQDVDILWEVICQIRTWLKYKFNRDRDGNGRSSRVLLNWMLRLKRFAANLF